MSDDRVKIDDDGKLWVNLGNIKSNAFGQHVVTINIGGREESRPFPSREEAEEAARNLLITAMMGFGMMGGKK